MKSPFKFLDSFEYEDRDMFFGRDKEIAALYRMVYRNPLTLIYGLSGTGKTSLVQCGLASKFKGPDWYPIFVRRGVDINESLEAQLDKASPASKGSPIKDRVRAINKEFLRPVYLIFDQFEELFTVGGDRGEQERFIESLKGLLLDKAPCRIILIMREEYLGGMYGFERGIPHIFDNRMRVEPMDRNRVAEVLDSSFTRFNIGLEAPRGDRMGEILDNVSMGKSGIQLPYLQVYLDMLYREDFQRAYGRERAGGELPRLEFTKEEIADFGKIDDVLDKYLEGQYRDIPAMLEGVTDGMVARTLDLFVTEEGTKIPIPMEAGEGGELTLSARTAEKLPDVSAAQLSGILSAAEQSRILRFTDSYAELAHDSLALAIDKRRTDEQRRLNEMRREIKSSHNVFSRTGDFLSAGQLELYIPHLEQLKLNDALSAFVEDSRKHHREENDRKKEELAKEKRLRSEAESNEKKAGQRTRIAWVFVLLAAVVAIFAFFQMDKADKALSDLENSKQREVERLEADYNTSMQDSLYDEASVSLNNLAKLGVVDEFKIKSSFERLALSYYDNSDKEKAITILRTMIVFAKSPKAEEALNKLPNDDKLGELFTGVSLRYKIMPQMIPIKGGTFQMGCDGSIDPNCGDNTLHSQTVSDFNMSATETTVFQYMLFCKERGYVEPDVPTSLKGKEGQAVEVHPVVNVNWYDVARYCNWLSVQAGLDTVYVFGEEYEGFFGTNYEMTIKTEAKGYRLPSEAEWEYAAKGGINRDSFVYSGSDTLDDVAWYNGNHPYTHPVAAKPVATKQPNKLGLYDLSGNVWEWCEDWYDDYPTTDTKDYRGPSSRGYGRVQRGGSWVNNIGNCRASARNDRYPSYRSDYCGFRVVAPQ